MKIVNIKNNSLLLDNKALFRACEELECVGIAIERWHYNHIIFCSRVSTRDPDKVWGLFKKLDLISGVTPEIVKLLGLDLDE